MKEILKEIAMELRRLGDLLESSNHDKEQKREAGRRSAEARAKKYGVLQPISERRSNAVREQVPPSAVPLLIGTYVKSWQNRYGTKARPDVGGKARGILNRLNRDRTGEELARLLQVFCQMENEWFVKKRHDLVTFEQNLNVISLALDKGHEMTAMNMAKVFGDGQRILPETDRPALQNVGRKELPAGADPDVLEEPSELF